MKRLLFLLFLFLLAVLPAAGQSVDISAFPGVTINAKLTAGEGLGCSSDTNVSCMLVIRPELSVFASGAAFTPARANTFVADYRTSPFGSVTLTATRVAFGSGTNTITSEAAFTYDAPNDTLRSGKMDVVGAAVAGIRTNTADGLQLGANGVFFWEVDETDGSFLPLSDNARDIGSPTRQPRNSYSTGQQIIRPGGIASVIPNNRASSYFFVEEFIHGAVCLGGTDNNERNCLGAAWWVTGTGVETMSGLIPSLPNHPGTRTLTTAGAAGDTAQINWTAASGWSWDTNWDTTFVVRGEQTDVNTIQRAGVSGNGLEGTAAATWNDGAYFEKLAADTNWFFVCRAAAAQDRLDTGIAHGTGFFTGRIRRVNATTIAFALCSGDGCTLPAETNRTTSCPAADSLTTTDTAYPGFAVGTAAAASKAFLLDYSDVLLTGIVR